MNPAAHFLPTTHHAPTSIIHPRNPTKIRRLRYDPAKNKSKKSDDAALTASRHHDSFGNCILAIEFYYWVPSSKIAATEQSNYALVTWLQH
jgi:hypothetical protein